MQTDTGVLFRGFSTRALQAVAGILSGKTPSRSESVASALTRVERLLNADADPENTLRNLPGLLGSRGFADDAASLESAVGAEQPRSEPAGDPEPAAEPQEPEPATEDPIATAEANVREAKAELGRILAQVAKAKGALRDAEAALRQARGGKAPKQTRSGATSPREPGRGPKVGKMIEMLQQPGGVTIDQLVDEFGWKPHTARARLSEPKKIFGARFHSTKEGRETVYKILPEA